MSTAECVASLWKSDDDDDQLFICSFLSGVGGWWRHKDVGFEKAPKWRQIQIYKRKFRTWNYETL